jgi:uncharacterized protein (DUF1697 family)
VPAPGVSRHAGICEKLLGDPHLRPFCFVKPRSHGCGYGVGMCSYAAFLRGMNVGGHRLTNDELRGHFEALGFVGVRTFRASGNVVFEGDRRAPEQVREEIEAGLAESLGYAVPTFVRAAAEVRGIAAARPFDAERLRSAGKLQVALLASPPSPGTRADALAMAGDRDGLLFDGLEVYWLPSGGVLDSALDMTKLARLLGSMTIRTKGTIEQIAAKHFA